MDENTFDLNDIYKIENRAREQGYLDGFDFSILIQRLLISKNGYIMDTGNWENANAVCAVDLIEKINKHPLLWKLFFMLA